MEPPPGNGACAAAVVESKDGGRQGNRRPCQKLAWKLQTPRSLRCISCRCAVPPLGPSYIRSSTYGNGKTYWSVNRHDF